jgi:putative ABC transport system permease protein
MHRLMNVDYYSGIVMEINSVSQMDESAKELRALFRRLHHIQPAQPDDFQVQNQKSLMDLQLAAASKLNFYIRWIGVSALIVSGFGIISITWIAVKERTREIGTRRALGATSVDIFVQTALESDALAVLGGVIGAVASWPASQLISRSVSLPFVFEWQSCAVAFAGGTFLNPAFCVLPARKAASVPPVEALRYE